MRPVLIKPKFNRRGALLVTLASLAYLSIGLPDGMVGVAWPSISGEFDVPISSLGILIASLTTGYGLATFSSGKVMSKTGAGAMVTTGAALTATGLLGYGVAPGWWTLLGCAAVAGVGVGIIDGGLNVYAALNFSARSTNWMHGFYSLGAATGPAVMTAFLVSDVDWRWGFVSAAGLLLALAVAFGATRSRWGTAASRTAGQGQSDVSEPVMATLRLPAMWLGIAMFVLYTGMEVTAGQWSFTLLTEGRGIATGTAGTWVTAYFLGITAGRIVLGMLMGVVPARRLLRASIIVSVLAAVIFWLDAAAWVSFAGIFLMGLSFGPVFPSLIATTPSRLGRSHTPNAIGFQVTAAGAGAALAPLIVGAVSGATSLEAISVSLVIGTAGLLVLYEVMERLVARRQ